MFNLIISFGIVATIFSAIVIPYTLFITFMFVIYKRTGGKKNYWEYMDLW